MTTPWTSNTLESEDCPECGLLLDCTEADIDKPARPCPECGTMLVFRYTDYFKQRTDLGAGGHLWFEIVDAP